MLYSDAHIPKYIKIVFRNQRQHICGSEYFSNQVLGKLRTSIKPGVNAGVTSYSSSGTHRATLAKIRLKVTKEEKRRGL
jgi:hypothetical protein